MQGGNGLSERKQLTEKFREAVASVLPITLIVTIVCFSFVPVTTDLMLSFLIGSVLLIVGMALFTLGSEVSMTQIGTFSLARNTPLCFRMASTSVVLPWSTWAMIATFLKSVLFIIYPSLNLLRFHLFSALYFGQFIFFDCPA